MAIGRAALLRPIEITASSDNFSLTVGGSTTARTISSGVYANIMTLANEVLGKMGVLAAPTLTFATSGANAGKITIGNSAVFSVTWTDTALRDILGFIGDLSGASSYTATYKPMYCWISDYTPKDREWWSLKHKDTFAGAVSRSGDLVGLGNGNRIYHRTLGFDAETGPNVFASMCTTDGQEAGALDVFIEGARASAPAVAASPATHGFWYVYSIGDLAATSNADISSYDGIVHQLHKWQWCHLSPDGLREPKASLGVGRDWFAFDLDIHTATPPTWDAPVVES